MAAALCKREFELLNRFKGLNRKEIQPEREVENHPCRDAGNSHSAHHSERFASQKQIILQHHVNLANILSFNVCTSVQRRRQYQ